MTPQQRQDWHFKCDPAVYLPEAKMPMLFVTGTNDFAYPLDSLQKSCLLPKGPVALCVRHEMPHGHEPGWAAAEINLFADQHLRDGIPLPEIGAPRREGNRVSVKFSSARPIITGYLLYTKDRGPWQTRKWHLQTITPSKGAMRAELPENASVYLMAIEDDRKAWVSSRHEVIDKS
jgi:hypothetical protein